MRRLRSRAGQATVEYLLVGAAIVAALLVVTTAIQGQVTTLGTAGADQVGVAAVTITAEVTPVQR